MERKCKGCGKMFFPPKKKPQTQNCSKECGRKGLYRAVSSPAGEKPARRPFSNDS